jgi:hypothetical protein
LKNLRSWFNNKGRSTPQKLELDLIQFHKPKKSKLRLDFQVYSKLFYEERIKEHAEKAWKEASEAFERGELQEKPHVLTVRQNVSKDLYQAESSEVQEQVREYKRKWNQAIDEGRNPNEDEESDGEDREEETEEERKEMRRLQIAQEFLE